MKTVLTLLLLSVASAADTQTPATVLPGQIAAPSSAAGDAKATGTIRGRIVLSSGRPARRASVHMTPLSGGRPAAYPSIEKQVAADLDGRYEFTDVAPGDYQISAGTPGYLALEYGQHRAFERGTALTLRNGETVERVDITLPPGGAISGLIVDENGDPIEGIDVQLMQLQFGANRRQLLAVNGVRRRVTDDRGQYRLYGVPPGRYIVMASTTPQPGARTSATLPSGYVPTYYPGTDKGSDAKTLTIDLSQNADGIDFAMARMRTARVSGTVVDAAGKPLRGTVLAMTSQRSGGLSGDPLSAATLADGTFEIRNVPPGDWVFQATEFARRDVNQGQENEFTSRFVTVEGADVSDIHLQTSIGSRVDGRIVFEGQGAPDPTGVTITTLPSDFDRAPMTGPSGMAIPRTDGTFVLEGLHGPRRFRLIAPDGWSLKAVRVNGIEVTETPLSFGTKDESLSDVEIVLTNKAASISGNVTDAQRQPVADYTVIVFATNAERWYQGSRFFTFTRPKSDGTFAVANLPPGEYYVAAVDRMQGTDGFGEWQDPAFLQSIAPRATRLTLSDGQSASVTTQLIVR